MKVKDIMTRKVFFVHEDSHLNTIEDIMNWHHVRHVPVLSRAHAVVGLITHRDLLNVAVSSFAKIKKEDQKIINMFVDLKNVMTRKVETTTPQTKLSDAAGIMLEKKIGCLPVVEQDKLVGILTEADFLKLADQF